MSDIEGLSRDALKARLVAAERQIANLRTGYGEILEEREIKNSQLAVLRAAQEWQDISTAPKTGEAILVACPQRVRMLGFWGKGASEPKGSESWRDSRWWKPIQPTHWMPIPAAPLIADERTK